MSKPQAAKSSDAGNVKSDSQGTGFYETDKAVSEYLLFHFGSANDLLFQGSGPSEALDFPRRCGLLHDGIVADRKRALDLGCAVGGAALAMSESFDEVVAIDFSHALIDAAKRVAGQGEARIEFATEGDLTRSTTISLPETAKPERVDFRQGDAMDLPTELGSFDFILMANLIDRLPDPAQCLQGIYRFVKPGGALAITSPYTWLEEYTPRDKWLGGFQENGSEVRAATRLRELLSPHFDAIEERNLPFLIREHERKNQYSIAHATIWRRR